MGFQMKQRAGRPWLGLAVAALLLMGGLGAQAMAETPKKTLVEGRDYVTLPTSDRFDTATTAGKIEVVEVFGYLCSHCAHFEPYMSAFAGKLPKDVVVRYVPASFNESWGPYARAYEAARLLGVANRSHGAMFRAIHNDRSLPMDNAAAGELAVFYRKYGIGAAKFIATYNSPAVTKALSRNEAWMMRKEVDATPTIIVDGRYRVAGRSWDDVLMNTGLLISEIRAKQPKPPAARKRAK